MVSLEEQMIRGDPCSEYDFKIILVCNYHWYEGIAFRRGKTTKPFKRFLNNKGLTRLVEWIEKKESEHPE